MIACCYYLFLLFSLLSSYTYGYEASSLFSTIFNDDDDNNNMETNNYEKSQSNDDQYIDESKYNSASHQYEEELLANIYAPNRTYISMHDDRIHPSNFSYFTFNNHGTYRFILISLRGDADLYVSTRNKYVSYDNYEMSSCTCGIDEILIDAYVKRPVYLGVYGYSQFQISHYRLLIELVDSTVPVIDETFFEQTNKDKTTNEQSKPRKNGKTSRVVVEGEDDKSHLLWNILLWLLNFLVEVLT